MLQTRNPSRFIGLVPGIYMVVGLSFKPEMDMNSDFCNLDLKFKIGDMEKPIDILSALQISEQKLLN